MAVTICFLLLPILMATDALNGNSFGSNTAQAHAGAGSNFPPWPNNFPFSANFPQFPKFPSFPNFQQFPTIKPITVDDIASKAGEPGSNINGVASFSQSSSTRGADGKINRTGGSTVIFNDNGKLTVQKTGNAPPEVAINQYNVPPLKPFKHQKARYFPKFESYTSKPVDTDVIGNYIPGYHEGLTGGSVMVNSFYSDVDGVRHGGGAMRTLTNHNGQIEEQQIIF